MEHHEIRNLFILLLWSALLAGLAGCSRPVPLTLDARSIAEKEQLIDLVLSQKETAARFKEWQNDRGERIGARVSVINVFSKDWRSCKEYFVDTFMNKSGHQLSDQDHQTVCFDPNTHTWVVRS